jgi:hypothetical protein
MTCKLLARIPKKNSDTVCSGSPLLSRLYNYFPERLISISYLDIGYTAPPLALTYADIEKTNNETLQTLGYSIFGYWIFLGEADAPSILNSHVSLQSNPPLSKSCCLTNSHS